MTSYSGVVYLLFFLPPVVLIYALLGKKLRPYFMLLAGYAFFITISKKLIIYLLFLTGSMYLIGLWLDKIKKKMKLAVKGLPKEEKKALKQSFINKQKRVVWLYVLLNLGIIIVLKYSGFIISNFDRISRRFNWGIWIDIPDFVVPIGISFYTFMGISYVLDV